MDSILRIIGYVLAALAAIAAAIAYAIGWTLFHFCYAIYLAWTAPDESDGVRFLG